MSEKMRLDHQTTEEVLDPGSGDSAQKRRRLCAWADQIVNTLYSYKIE